MKDKKHFCVLHGALNNSNFGDYLFGAIFLNKSLEVRPDRVLIADMPRFGVSQKFREEMHYNLKCGLRGFIRADLLVYISGGYFENVDPGDEWHFRWLFLRNQIRNKAGYQTIPSLFSYRPTSDALTKTDRCYWGWRRTTR